MRKWEVYPIPTSLQFKAKVSTRLAWKSLWDYEDLFSSSKVNWSNTRVMSRKEGTISSSKVVELLSTSLWSIHHYLIIAVLVASMI